MMQHVINPEAQEQIDSPARQSAAIPLEWFAYLAVAALALALRLIDTGAIPLLPTETHNALAAWRAASTSASGDPLVSTSPLLFLLQAASFTSFGSTELASRFGVILAGTFVVLSPVLFRRWIGASQAFIFSVLLALSPTLLAASRFGSPVVLSFAVGAIFLWALWRYAETRASSYGITAVVSAAVMIFLAERGGTLLFATLIISALVACWWTRKVDERYSFDENDDNQSLAKQVTAAARGISWEWALPISVLIVFGASTAFLLYPSGLSAVGESLSGAVTGFVEPSPNHPSLYPLLISWYYEPFIWVAAVIGLIILIRRDALTLADRFLAIWAVLGAILSGLFIGGEAAHALWTVIPLTGLTARLVGQLLRVDTDPGSWGIPYWARFLAMLVMLALLAVFVLAFQDIARAFTEPQNPQSLVPLRPTSWILIIVTVAFAVVIMFMGASIWNMRTMLRGLALALLLFGTLTSLGAGWRLSTVEAGNPLELWHLSTTHRDSGLLRKTLLELGDRESRGFTLVPISVYAPQDGITAWVVRDFTNAEFISDIVQARGDGIVLLDADIEPDLGGAYVGQDFTMSSTWDASTIPVRDFLGWWTQNKVSPETLSMIQVDTSYLWLRQDIWQGSNQQP